MAGTTGVSISMAPSRDTKNIMGYVNPDPPAGAGILTVANASAEEYKKHRRLMINNHEVPFFDARTTAGGLGSWDLEKHGFQVFAPPPLIDFTDKSLVRGEYYPKLVEAAKRLTGAKNGYCFLYATRDENPKYVGIAYSRFAHSDGGPDSPPTWRKSLVKRWGVPEEEAMSCEILMVNIWFPRDRPAYRDPLCLLDGTSIGNLSEETANIRYVNAKGEVFTGSYSDSSVVNSLIGPTYSPKHRWVYISDQRPDEAWIFKQWDTRNDGRCKMTFHNSFHDPFYDASPETPPRRSAEFRVLLTFPKDEAAASSKL